MPRWAFSLEFGLRGKNTFLFAIKMAFELFPGSFKMNQNRRPDRFELAFTRATDRISRRRQVEFFTNVKCAHINEFE
jgi:hypothetical protein